MRGHERAQWRVKASVEKWDADQADYVRRATGVIAPSGALMADYATPTVLEVDGNMLLTAGLSRLTSLLIGAGGQALTNTACRLGAGNSNTAEAVGQADLQAAAGAANRWFQVMDATFPTQANGVVTFKATFGANDGNFDWREWGVDVSAPVAASSAVVGPTLFNRKVAALGTKANGAIWALTATVTIS